VLWSAARTFDAKGEPSLRPRIGISAYWRPASFGPWIDMHACMVPSRYVEGVSTAGGTPLLIPPDPAIADDPSSVLDAIDGLVLVGGDDIDPATYGAAPGPTTDPPNVRRDRAELSLLRGAVARDMPVLGVCRGVQIMNIVYGGDLVQEIADVVEDPRPHRPRLGEFGRHAIEVRGGLLRELVGGRIDGIHSHHHQGLGRIGQGLVVTAEAPDGTPEALEDPDKTFCVGVLWHPEEDHDGGGRPLFEALVARARQRAAARV
jgi:gamma-glutamyl-gamma-aminobutyrate hydrolase PuuD